MSTLFTKIINREIPAEIVFENDAFIAFLDINPQMPGHTLVCPKKEVDSIFDLDDKTYHALWDMVKYLEKPLLKAMNAKRIVLEVVGFEIPHVHVHMIPMNILGEGRSKKVTSEELQEFGEKIRSVLKGSF